MNIRVKCMYVFGVWMCVRVFWSAQALSDATNAPYISSLKIIELIHFWKILGPSEEIYNLQSLWITLYIYAVDAKVRTKY